MDALGARYWPGETFRPHSMRKFCAFWGPYERFLFLDADIVVLRSLAPYFAAFRSASGDFMYFWTDLTRVYRPPLLHEMVSAHGAVGFQTGVFMGRTGTLTESRLESLLAQAQPRRDEFVDILEQTFLNYTVDVAGLRKVSAREAAANVVDAWAGMRLRRTRDGLVLADSRTPAERGRPVTLIHWGGYRLGPFMPYRRIFLAYRMRNEPRPRRIAYRAASVVASLKTRRRHPARWLAYRWLALGRNWLASRGYPAWLGSG
jgi:hypothetical protein